MWTKDCGFTGSCIGQIEEGEVRVAGMKIRAGRGPQQSIFVYVEHVEYPKRKTKMIPGKAYPVITKYTRMAGIGAYGWDNPTKRLMAAAGKKNIPKGAQLMLGSLTDEDGKNWEAMGAA